MRLLFLLTVLLVAAPRVYAQYAPPDSLITTLATPVPPAPDTVAAIHRLFASRRQDVPRAVITSLGAGVGEGALALALLSGQITVNQSIVPIILIPVGSIAIVGVSVYFFQYNRRHEQRALAKWQVHKLPKWVKHELKPTFFH